MRTIWFVVILCALSASAYSPLRKQPPIRTDIYEESKKKADESITRKAKLIVIRDSADSKDNKHTSQPHKETRAHHTEMVINEQKIIREKRYDDHSEEHVHYHIPHPDSPYDIIHADVHYHPDPLQQHVHYRIPDPYSPYGGHYHADVHYHYDPFSGQLYPHSRVRYHPHRA